MKPINFYKYYETKLILLLAVGFLSLLFGRGAFSQQLIDVNLQQPPPGKLSEEDLWKLILTNTTQSPQTVYLNAVVTDVQEGKILSAQSANFTLSPGTKRIQRSEIEPINTSYANPFNSVTTIKFDIPKESVVNLVNYDILGREAATLVTELLQPGTYKVDGNVKNHLPSEQMDNLIFWLNINNK